MGGIVSYFWEDKGRIDDPNPITGLTSRDCYHIKKTWDKIRANVTEFGMDIFINLFIKFPQYKDLFPFRDVPTDDLRPNKRFQAHCNSLMYALSSIVDNVGQPELVKELLLKQGSAHVPRGVEFIAYWRLKDVLLELFKPMVNEEGLQSWSKVLDVCFNTIIQGAKTPE